MKPPKQKPKMRKPKITDKTLRTHNRVRGVSSMIKENIPDGDNKNMNEYASDNVIEKGEYAVRKGTDLGKKTVVKGYNSVKERIKTRESKSDNSEIRNGNNKTDIKQKQAQHGKTVQAKNTYKTNSRVNEIKNNKAIDKNARNAKTKQSIVNKKPKVKGKAYVKANKKAIKKTQKSIKTVQNTARATVKTTQKSVKAAKRANAIAKNTAKVSVKTAKLTAKALIQAFKSAIAALKSMVAAIAAGGWVVVVIILVIVLIVALAASPWGIFFEDTDENTPTLSEVVKIIDNEFNNKIMQIILDAGNVDETIIDFDKSSNTYRTDNWIDVIGVFAVKTSTDSDNPMDVLIMDDKKIKKLQDVFWDMNSIKYQIIEEIVATPVPSPTETPEEPTPTPDPDISPTPSPTPTPEIHRTLIISIESMTYEQGAEEYGFNNNQLDLLNELMSPEYYSMFMEICGMDSFNGLTPEQAAQLINDLPEGVLGSEIVKYALSRLGDPYSQAKRGQNSYVDCSYLTRWCYQQVGINTLPSTAAEQARYCVNNNLTIAKSALQPGDLIFWSFNTNGRFMNITHTGIYAGNGMVIDASSSRGMVSYREIFGSSSQVLYGRPHVE